MYNGIGLTSTRGTGTSGHVQRNVAALRPQPMRSARHTRKAPSQPRPLPPALAEHERRRAVEVAVAELHDELVARRYDEHTIRFMEKRLRQDLLSRDSHERAAPAPPAAGASLSHLVRHRNDALRAALNVSEHYVPGDAFRRKQPAQTPKPSVESTPDPPAAAPPQRPHAAPNPKPPSPQPTHSPSSPLSTSLTNQQRPNAVHVTETNSRPAAHQKPLEVATTAHSNPPPPTPTPKASPHNAKQPNAKPPSAPPPPPPTAEEVPLSVPAPSSTASSRTQSRASSHTPPRAAPLKPPPSPPQSASASRSPSPPRRRPSWNASPAPDAYDEKHVPQPLYRGRNRVKQLSVSPAPRSLHRRRDSRRSIASWSQSSESLRSRSPSPDRYRSRSRRYRNSRSERESRSPSPRYKRSPSPYRWRRRRKSYDSSPSPERYRPSRYRRSKYLQSPSSPSVDHRYYRDQARSPSRSVSRSPRRFRSRSPLPMKSRATMRSRSPSPLRERGYENEDVYGRGRWTERPPYPRSGRDKYDRPSESARDYKRKEYGERENGTSRKRGGYASPPDEHVPKRRRTSYWDER
ncbi:unnamed protein product [Agarophyton chilense]|eukprot:gb/GEZJ01001964.1/.p1 GENE.gb/GEZJ01001964.1/~~gb/GEZJ01001964.1/.p1  ORF type:complete len:576 (+),score=74.73 gb/GEZJ01001964.1/:3295-5022(+)